MATKNTAPAAAQPELFDDVHTKFEAYTGKEPYLFVSYSHRDSKMVYSILDELYDHKYRLWYDESCENGNDFRDELRQKIKAAEAVILFVSQWSMASPFCGMEIIVAREYGKRLYPIYLDDSVIPPAFEILLSNTHHSTVKDRKKLISTMIRDLPAEAMDRLTIENDRLEKCEDNGKSIQVDEGITTICRRAFQGRRALHHIQLPTTLRTIEQEAFRGCANLEEMEIPAATTRICDSAFRDCVSMRRLVVENDRVKIGERAFENCASLESIQLPDGMTEIYGGVFNSCKSLRSICLPQHLTILGESAFSDCEGLEEIVVPENVTKIDDLTFNGCTGLKSVTLNNGLRKIGKSAFKNCRMLTRIEIPESVAFIDNAPFRGCESMKSIQVAPRNKYFKSAPSKRDGNDFVLFNKNKSILIAYPASSREVQYDVPDSVVTISDWAFSECRKLSRITIPDSVHDIGEGAFSNCALLDEVEIPDSVTRMDDCAFRGCVSLERVLIPDSVKDLGWGLFDGCDKVVVYCREGSAAENYCRRNGIRFTALSEGEGLAY